MAGSKGKSDVQCSLCGKFFKQASNLKTHISRVHGNEKPFSCADCGRTFGYKSHFKAHIRSHFLQQLPIPLAVKNRLHQPFSCDNCPRSFQTQRQLTQHLLSHSGGQPFTCDICGKLFSSKRGVALHVVRHDKHTNKKIGGPKELTPCEICGKEVARYSIQKHLNTHSRRRIYPCRVCSKEFLEATHRKVHERTHTGQKPFSCDLCGKTFTQVGNLKVHMRRIHKHQSDPSNEGKSTTQIVSISSTIVNAIDNPLGTRDTSTDNESSVTIVNDYEEDNSKVLTTGKQTIQDFVKLATNWIIKEQDTDKPEPISRKSDSKKEWNKREKDEIWKRLVSEIGENQVVKGLIKRLENTKGDKTRKLLRKVGSDLPANSLVNCEESGALIWNCWDCPSKATTCYLFLRHRLSHASSEVLPYKCDICGRTFSQSGNLQHHLLVHKGEFRFACEHCGSLFRHKSHLNNHMSNHEEKKSDFRYICAYCDKGFNSRFHLIQHIRTHTRERPYQCLECGKKFSASSTFHRHSLTHASHKEKCPVCNREFSHISTLRRHQAVHGVRRRFECTCGRSFTQPSSLRRHKTTCSPTPNLKPHKCSVCSKTFLDSGALGRHEHTHESFRSFPCLYCSLHLKTKETLKRHIERKHGDRK